MFKKIFSIFKKKKVEETIETTKKLKCSCSQYIYESTPHKTIGGRRIHRIGAVNYNGVLFESFCNGKETKL